MDWIENEELRRLQLTELEILKEIEKVCRKYGIAYSLHFGSLLGAIRHGGFIPWDDDLDISMSRAEYNRFLEAWEEEKPNGFFLQNKENTPAFTQSFSKVRKNHTCFLQYEWEKGRYHTGIFVDVFPIDRIPMNQPAKLLFQWNAMFYQVLTREFVPPRGSILQKVVSKILLTVVPPQIRSGVRRKKLAAITKYENREDLPRVGIQTNWGIQHPLPATLTDSFVMFPFEDGDYPCTAVWEEFLNIEYKNYKEFPPVEKRVWTHHPLVLDFERNYEELSNSEG